MPLPEHDARYAWSEWKKSYKITTPTFSLTTLEKPDLSPFLIHMTGKSSLLSILKGENTPNTIAIHPNEGYLKAVKPDFEGKDHYNSEVVCFTESPLFALDFFRYRSLNRFKLNQQFGIGFSKSDLITNRGVRPVVYFDTQTNSDILKLCEKVIDGSYRVIDANSTPVNYKDILERIKPLLFPLLEDKPEQGFMWEREWRYPDKNGLVFSYGEIKVICCPKEERGEISNILSAFIGQIDIVESWKEYDEITTYLKRRENEKNQVSQNKITEIGDLDLLEQLKSQNDQTLNVLSSHYSLFKETTNGLEALNIAETLDKLKNTSEEITEQIKKVEEQIKREKEEAKEKENK
jgi:hypothetical protein